MKVAPLPRLVLCLSLTLFHGVPASAQQIEGFGERPSRDIVVPLFTDQEISRALSILDTRLSGSGDASARLSTAERTYFDFSRYLQTGRLSAAQQAQVLAHLDAIERTHPAEAPLLARPRRIVTGLTIGKPAPEIVGKDLDGKEFRLSDYRGKVVVVTFGGEWCGICKTEYPYLRLLTEVYSNWPFAILGVNSDATQDLARQTSRERGLQYRIWWDGHGPKNTGGPIATDWNVVGWPTTYVIDSEGVIRFIDLRQDDLVRGVKQLMTEVSRTLERGTR